MDEKLKELYGMVECILDDAPDEDCCTEEEIEMYYEMQNLKEAMGRAGYIPD